MKDHIIAANAYVQLRDELTELKTLVREFMIAIERVPFRAVDCDQVYVDELIDRLTKATREKK